MNARLWTLCSLIVIGLIVGLFASRQHLLDWQIKLARPPVSANAPPDLQVRQITSPILFLVLDTSQTLRKKEENDGSDVPEGNDPENNEFKATRLLFKLAHHFSVGEGGFSPRLGVLAFGSSPQWLELNGKRVWELQTPSQLDEAVRQLDKLIGGTGKDDQRRAKYTDYNGPFIEVYREIEKLSRDDHPLVLLMTDGMHEPNPTKAWNWPEKYSDRPRLIWDKIQEGLEKVDVSKNIAPGPVSKEFLDAILDNYFEGKAPPKGFQNKPVWEYLTDKLEFEIRPLVVGENAVEGEKVKSDVLNHAETRLLNEYVPQLARRARLEIVGLGKGEFPPVAKQLLPTSETDQEKEMWDGLGEIAKSSGQGEGTRHWCNDSKLVNRFVEIFERGMPLLKVSETLKASFSKVVGNAKSMAVLVVGDLETTLTLQDEKGSKVKSFRPEEVFGKRTLLFLLDAPPDGEYVIARQNPDPKLPCSVTILIQTDPLFQVVDVIGRENGGIDIGPPIRRIVAYSPKMGRVVNLDSCLDSTTETMEGVVTDYEPNDGQDVKPTHLGKVKWTVRKDDRGVALDFESNIESWESLCRLPGRYWVTTTLNGLKYRGVKLTQQAVVTEFEIEPGFRTLVLDAVGGRRDELRFPWRRPHITKD